jgi:hypothetical protein
MLCPDAEICDAVVRYAKLWNTGSIRAVVEALARKCPKLPTTSFCWTDLLSWLRLGCDCVNAVIVSQVLDMGIRQLSRILSTLVRRSIVSRSKGESTLASLLRTMAVAVCCVLYVMSQSGFYNVVKRSCSCNTTSTSDTIRCLNHDIPKTNFPTLRGI